MKKNIFDTDIQMIDLDSVGDMEVDYDDFSEPNTELAGNIEMAMKETQVFSADEVENALIKEAGLQGMGDTRVIDLDLENAGVTQVFEFDESEKEALKESAVKRAGSEASLKAGIESESKEYAEENAETEEDYAEEAGSDYISTKGEEDDWEFDDFDEKPVKDRAKYDDVSDEESEEYEEYPEDDASEEEYEEETSEAEEEYSEEDDAEYAEDDEAGYEEDDGYESEDEYEEDDEYEDYEDDSEDVKERRVKEKKVKERSKKKSSEKPHDKKAAAAVKNDKQHKKAEEKKKAEAHKKAEDKRKTEAHKKAEDKKKAEAHKTSKNTESGKTAKKADADKNSKNVNAAVGKNKNQGKKAYSDTETNDINNVDGSRRTNSVKKADGRRKANNQYIENDERNRKGGSVFAGMGIVEYIGVAMLIAVIILLGVLSFKLISNNNNKHKLEQFASIGVLYENIDKIGNEGIKAIGEKASIDSVTPSQTEETVSTEETKPEEPEKEVKQLASVSVNFSSIEKDLKIKFTDKNTGKLVTGVRFEVSAKGPGGKEYSWADTDMDGVIYVDNLAPGNYEVVVLSTDEYEFPQTATTVKVQDTVVYQVINVIDEAVDMSQVDLAQEDNQNKDVDQGTTLQDTVAYVESTATPIGGTDGFVKINKSDIKDPRTLTSAFEWGGFRKVDVSKEMFLGDSDRLAVALEDGQTVEWTGGNDCVTVDSEGNILAIKVGNATINANIRDASGNVVKVEPFNITVKDVPSGNNPEPETGTPDDDGIIHVKGITLSDAQTTVGKSVPIFYEIKPLDATNQNIRWKSSDETIATVDESGIVTGLKPGEVTITAITEDGNKSAKAKVTVQGALNLTLTLTGSDGKEAGDMVLIPGETYQLVAKVDGATGDSGVTFSSSNNCVSVSDNGLITAQTIGSAEITVTTNEPDQSGAPVIKRINITVQDNGPMNDTTSKLMYYSETEKKDVQVYIKNSAGNYVEAKWADYYKDGVEFFIKGGVTYKYTGWQTIDGNVYYFDQNGNKVTGEQVIGGTKYTFASDGSLVNTNGVRGIDVSGYNGTIDWTAVKNSGISFVIIRCGFRGYTKGGLILDSKYQSYIQGATSAGLKVGLYLFSQAVNEAEAVEEASLCVNLAQGYKISYPIFIDSEYANGARSGRADKLDKAGRTAVCKAFCETIKSAGYTPGVYASKSWFYDKLDAGQLSSYKIWLAHYTSQTDYSGRYDMWQHTDKGSVNGIKGNVDLDISYLGY